MKSFYKHINAVKGTAIYIMIFLLSILSMLLPIVSFNNIPEGVMRGKTIVFIASLSVIIILYVIKFLNYNSRKIKVSSIDVMIFLYGFYILINIICKNVSMSDRVLELIGLYILYILLRSNKSVHLWNVVVISIIIGGIIQVFYGILQQCGLVASNHDIFKITGSFYNPGSYGGYLASIFPIVLGIKLYRKDLSINFRFLSYPLMRYALNIALFLFLFSIASSQSRAAWLSVIFTSVLFLLDKYRVCDCIKKIALKRKRFITVLSSIIVLCGLIAALYSFKSTSAKSRLYIWKISCSVIDKRNFLTGTGFDSFCSVYMNKQVDYLKAHHTSPFIHYADNTDSCFNEFIQSMLETGVIGLVLLITVLISVCFAKNKSQNKWISIVKYGIIGIFIFSLFSYPSHILPIKYNLFTYMAYLSFLSSPCSVFKMNKIYSILHRVSISIVLIIVCCIGLSYINTYYKALNDWSKALRCYYYNSYGRSLLYFKRAKPMLSNNGMFLNNYGKALSCDSKPNESIYIMGNAIKICPNSFSYITIGHDYEQMHKPLLAEKAYLTSYWMSPAKFYPLYMLVKLYKKEGQYNKALDLGQKMLRKDVKVSSYAVYQMQNEVMNIIKKKY